MKYAGSYHATLTQTAAGTSYSEWFDISWANEIYAYVTYTWSETINNDESATVSLQRFIPLATTLDASGTDVLTFSTRTATTTVEEKMGQQMYDDAAPGAENQMGMRVRFELISTGTDWATDQIITVVCALYAKRN